MAAAHTVPYVVFRLVFLLTETRAETEQGMRDGGREREKHWYP